MACETQTTGSPNQPKCIHFSTNCYYENNTFTELTDSSFDVDFIFVPKEEGGLDLEASPIQVTWQKKRKGWADAKRWGKEMIKEFPGYHKPLPICLERGEETRGSTLKGYERLAKVCTKEASDVFPPYIHAFESKKSSLTNFQSNPKNIYLVKIGVPGHYTLGVIKIDPWSHSVDCEFFDPAGYSDYFPGRNQCLVKGRRKDQNEETLLLAAICAFLKYKTHSRTNKFNFMVVNSLNLQIMQQDLYCQTWVLMYIYFIYILKKDVNFVQWLQHVLHHTKFAQTALDIVLEFGKWITHFPIEYQRLGPLRNSSTFDSWKSRICAMNLNMKELIQMVNEGSIDTFLETNTFELYDEVKLNPLKNTYLRGNISQKPNPKSLKDLRNVILKEIPLEYKDENEKKKKKKEIENALKKRNRAALEELLKKIRQTSRRGIDIRTKL